MCHWSKFPNSHPHSFTHSICRKFCSVISHQSMAPCPGPPVSLCPPNVLHPPSHLWTLSQSSPVSPSLLHHPGSVHVGPSPCLSSWGSRTHTTKQPPNIHLAQRAIEISACHTSLCLCPESCFTTFSLSIKSRDLWPIIKKVLNSSLLFCAAVMWMLKKTKNRKQRCKTKWESKCVLDFSWLCL